MINVKITVLRISSFEDLIEKYELPQSEPCSMKLGQSFLSVGAECPPGFCQSAWGSLFPFVFALAHGGKQIFGAWMKNERSAMVSCNDGFRPVSFLLEAVEE